MKILEKFPKAFLGFLVGLVLGGIGGQIFADMGFVPALPWKEIFIFFGALFGIYLGYNEE